MARDRRPPPRKEPTGDVLGHLLIEASGTRQDVDGTLMIESSGMREDEKKCPYCDEIIKKAAKKCRFCMEWLTASGRKE